MNTDEKVLNQIMREIFINCIENKNIDITNACIQSNLIFSAVRSMNYELVEALIKYGINVNIRNMNCQTPLMIAVEVGNVKIVKLLLEGGADASMEDCDGHTVIEDAVHYKHYELVKMLCEHEEAKNAKR